MTSAKRKRGRYVKWSQTLANAICDRISNGESLNKICRDKNMPGITTVKDKLLEDEVFSAKYAHAREDQADHYADEIIAIADNADPADAAKTRLQIDARKWVASKLKPKKYSEKLAVGGADDMPAINLVISEIDNDL